MRGPADGNAHRLEAGILDSLEVVGLEGDAPVAFFGSFQGIAKIDATAEKAVVMERVFHFLVGASGFQSEDKSAHDRQQFSHHGTNFVGERKMIPDGEVPL